MSRGGALRTAVIVAVLVVLQYAVQPLMPWRASPDFLIIALLYAAIRLRPGSAAVLGFALGLVTDSLTLGALGAGAVAMTFVGFGASRLKATFFADTVGINAAFIFLGKWVFDVLYVLASHSMSPGETLVQIFFWSILSAAFTAVVGVLIFGVLRPISGREARPA